MGAALTDIGDRARAAPAFTQGTRYRAQTPTASKYVLDSYYGSLLRDVAGLTAMSAEGRAGGLDPGARLARRKASIRA